MLSLTQAKEVPAEKMLTAEVNIFGTTCANTKGLYFSSSTGFSDETAIQAADPNEVYTRPSRILPAPRAMHELSTPPHTTRTPVGRPICAATSGSSSPST